MSKGNNGDRTGAGYDESAVYAQVNKEGGVSPKLEYAEVDEGYGDRGDRIYSKLNFEDYEEKVRQGGGIYDNVRKNETPKKLEKTNYATLDFGNNVIGDSVYEQVGVDEESLPKTPENGGDLYDKVEATQETVEKIKKDQGKLNRKNERLNRRFDRFKKALRRVFGVFLPGKKGKVGLEDDLVVTGVYDNPLRRDSVGESWIDEDLDGGLSGEDLRKSQNKFDGLDIDDSSETETKVNGDSYDLVEDEAEEELPELPGSVFSVDDKVKDAKDKFLRSLDSLVNQGVFESNHDGYDNKFVAKENSELKGFSFIHHDDDTISSQGETLSDEEIISYGKTLNDWVEYYRENDSHLGDSGVSIDGSGSSLYDTPSNAPASPEGKLVVESLYQNVSR